VRGETAKKGPPVRPSGASQPCTSHLSLLILCQHERGEVLIRIDIIGLWLSKKDAGFRSVLPASSKTTFIKRAAHADNGPPPLIFCLLLLPSYGYPGMVSLFFLTPRTPVGGCRKIMTVHVCVRGPLITAGRPSCDYISRPFGNFLGTCSFIVGGPFSLPPPTASFACTPFPFCPAQS